MNKLNASLVCQVLDNLIGSTEAVGDTAVDNVRLHNLKTLIEVINWCLDGVAWEAEKTNPELSICKSRETAIDALIKWEKWIKETIDENESH